MAGQRTLDCILLAGVLLASCGKDPPKDPHLSIDLTRKPDDGLNNSFAATMGQLDTAAVAEKCGPSIVVIVGATKQGSGVIIGNDLVVTNAHVVEDEKSLEVRLRTGEKLAGTIHAVDPEMDLALVRIPKGSYAVAQLGDDTKLRPGEGVVAIGAPLGLEQTVSSGEVAALRAVDTKQGSMRVIQISVPISRGSSGGGLFDRQGKLVGITTAGIDKGQNLNFAMPVTLVDKLMQAKPAK